MDWSSQTAPVTLIELLERQAAGYDKRAIYSFLSRDLDITQSISFGGLYQKAKACSGYLQKFYGKGDVLLLCFPFGLDFIVAFWAAVLTGCIPIPIARPRVNEWQRVGDIAQHSEARALLTNSEMGSVRADVFVTIDAFRLIHIDTISADPNAWVRPHVSPQDCAFVQFTSGSCSAPKGVCVSNENILSNLLSIRENFECCERDITLSWLPFHHDMGLVGHVIQPLFSGMHNYFLSPMHFLADPCLWLRAISKFKATVSGAPNFAYEMCCSHVRENGLPLINLSSWRLAYCGAEPVSSHTASKFFRVLAASGFSSGAFQPCYGMAESTLFISSKSGLFECRLDGSDRAYVCLGSSPNCDIRIVDRETGNECTDKAVGEVWVRSSSVVKQYFKDESRTRETLQMSLKQDTGFLCTGDLGFKSNKELYVVGRSKNLIKQRGRSVYGEDVERVLGHALHNSRFKRCAILDIDTLSPSLLVLVIESTERGVMRSDVSALSAGLKEHVLREFGLLVQHVVIVGRGQLPLTTSGKLKREESKKALLSHLMLTGDENG
jgi:acyl-CoA synthetase (AMP-forming)/AMP-acid ligase II